MTGIIEMKFVHSLKSRVSTALVIGLIACSGALAEERPLPERTGPPVKTTTGVPHVQLGVKPAPEVNAAFLRRVASLPNVEIRPTVVSLPGAQGFWLLEDLPLARPDVIVGGREFAHVHPDGSLHASLPPERAREAVAQGWAVRHPWADQRSGWEGFVMLFTPSTMAEMEVTFQLVLDGYNFVVGTDLQAEDYAG